MSKSLVILDLVLRKIQSEKLHGDRDAIFLEKLRFRDGLE